MLHHGAKVLYIASLNDQVVPVSGHSFIYRSGLTYTAVKIYSASFTAASHPSILRALYMDGDAYR